MERIRSDSSSNGNRPQAKNTLKNRIMEGLDQEQPLITRALSQKLELHQSSVSHTLKKR